MVKEKTMKEKHGFSIAQTQKLQRAQYIYYHKNNYKYLIHTHFVPKKWKEQAEYEQGERFEQSSPRTNVSATRHSRRQRRLQQQHQHSVNLCSPSPSPSAPVNPQSVKSVKSAKAKPIATTGHKRRTYTSYRQHPDIPKQSPYHHFQPAQRFRNEDDANRNISRGSQFASAVQQPFAQIQPSQPIRQPFAQPAAGIQQFAHTAVPQTAPQHRRHSDTDVDPTHSEHAPLQRRKRSKKKTKSRRSAITDDPGADLITDQPTRPMSTSEAEYEGMQIE